MCKCEFKYENVMNVEMWNLGGSPAINATCFISDRAAHPFEALRLVAKGDPPLITSSADPCYCG